MEHDFSSEDLKLVPPPTLTKNTDPYDPEPEREKVRKNIAYLLVSLFAGAVIYVAGMAWLKNPSPDLGALSTAVVSPVLGVTGTVLGFYFAGKSK